MDTGDCGGVTSGDFRTVSPVGLVEREHSCGRLRADGALHEEAAGGTKRDGHGSLAGRRIVGGEGSNRKERRGVTKGLRRLGLPLPR